MKKRKKGQGGKLNRSEIIQARLDPKLKFAAEIISKKERRTLSSLIESSIEVYLKACRLDFETDEGKRYSQITIDQYMEMIWDPDEIIRFMKVGFITPSYLTSKEHKLWYFIFNTSYFWAHYQATIRDPKGNFIRHEWWPYLQMEGFLVENVKKYWDKLKSSGSDAKIKIPDKPGKIIEPPPGEDTEDEESYDFTKQLANEPEEKVRFDIWKQHVSSLVQKEYETIKTSKGEKIKIKMIYPTPDEQKAMVDHYYDLHVKHKKCLSDLLK